MGHGVFECLLINPKPDPNPGFRPETRTRTRVLNFSGFWTHYSLYHFILKQSSILKYYLCTAVGREMGRFLRRFLPAFFK